jgi:hypothetical protein
MKLNRILPLTFLAAAACGGSASTSEFRANAPTFEKLAIAQNDGDMSEAAAAPSIAALTDAASTPDCHPHLFVRTGEIVGRVNRHFRKHLHHVEELIGNDPIADGETRTWENVRQGLDRRFSMSRTVNLDGSATFAFVLEVAAVPASGAPVFVKVMSGSLTHLGPADADDSDAGAGARVENKGEVTFDYTALASVSGSERSSGQITDAFDDVHDPVKGVKRSASITLTNFVPEEGDRHGPRTGSYTWEREPGVGGKFQFQDTATLFCLPNPAGVESDLTTVARWYKAAGGEVHGRTDAKATGGQLPAGGTWSGVTCARGQTTSAPAEGFWMMKLEDAAGATVTSHSAQLGAEPCDPVFGAVPSATDNSTDYDFSAAVTFPGEW